MRLFILAVSHSNPKVLYLQSFTTVRALEIHLCAGLNKADLPFMAVHDGRHLHSSCGTVNR